MDNGKIICVRKVLYLVVEVLDLRLEQELQVH